jgi:hypothetical protein
MSNTYAYDVPQTYMSSDVSERSAFITRTYTHLVGAIFAFTGIEIALFKSGYDAQIANLLMHNWMLTLGAFIILGWIGSSFAANAESKFAQYFGLTFYVVAEAIIFVPLLYIANQIGPGIIESAAQVTLLGFLGLTMIVFVTRKDFSFLRSVLMWGGVVALLLIFGALFFGMHLGTWFSVGMIALAGASILYDTSEILHHYPTDRHVGAALHLFASVALLFWYVLRLFISSND